MSENQWEFCQLWFDNVEDAKVSKGFLKGTERVRGYGCRILYFSPTGKTTHLQLAEVKNPMDYNPFYKALGLLGGSGWELVSIQFGNKYGGGGTGGWSSGEDALVWYNEVASFKRLVITGRATDEPSLKI